MDRKERRAFNKKVVVILLDQVTHIDPETKVKYGLQSCVFRYPFGRSFNSYRLVIFKNDSEIYTPRVQTPVPLKVIKILVAYMETQEKNSLNKKVPAPNGSVIGYLKTLDVKATDNVKSRITARMNRFEALKLSQNNQIDQDDLEDWEK